MGQTRMDRFIIRRSAITNSRSGRGLFDLPSSIRLHIYKYLDTHDGQPHAHLNQVKARETQDFHYKKPRACFPLYPLLLVCRKIYQEVCPIVYGRWSFVIAADGFEGLGPLFYLSRLALRAIKTIVIFLNGWGGYDCDCTEYGEIEFDEYRSSLRRESKSDIDLMNEWEDLCRHLAENIAPGRLQLCLICDAKDATTANGITYSMHQLPRLAACSIRLTDFVVPALRNLAVSTANMLIDERYEVVSASVVLPTEIQIRVLEQSDLVAPARLIWTPLDRVATSARLPNVIGASWTIDGDATCELCSNLHLHGDLEWRTRPSAHSTCSCWRFPEEMFLLSRPLHEEAIRIFYSRNDLVVYGGKDDGDYWLPLSNSPFSLQPPRSIALQWLRSLHIIVPEIRFRPASLSDVASTRWLPFLDSLQQHSMPNRLSLILDFSQSRKVDIRRTGRNSPSSTANDEYAALSETCIMSAMIVLKGLKDFFVYGSPTEERDEGYLKQRQREACLEQIVMGPDYDAIARCKAIPQQRKAVKDLPYST